VSRGRLLILSAPSGAGKTSLARALIEAVPETVMSVSHTTRSRRNGEHDGIDYHFVDADRFADMVEAGRFLEFAGVYDHLYGTDRDSVQDLLESGKNVVLDIDWQGARQVCSLMPGATSVSIMPPSQDELERRLRSRGQDSAEVIERRMRKAVDEIRHCAEAEHLVWNDDFDMALSDLVGILEGGRIRPGPTGLELEKLIQERPSQID
jgi:guanylate kinase